MRWFMSLLVVIVFMHTCAGSGRAQVLVWGDGSIAGDASLTEPSASLGRAPGVWEPVEWQFRNESCSGNPYDLVAKATFTHVDSGQRIVTELFYHRDDIWKLRFTGTRAGEWRFVTASADEDLDDLRGEVNVVPNPGAPGFMTHYGNRWGWLGLDQAFVPQYVSYVEPRHFHDKPEKVDADIQTWFVEHGFNGFNTFGACAWFDINRAGYDEIDSSDPNPDPRMFEALELLIGKVQGAGGDVHIWVWGDEQRKMTPVKWGINGPVDQRLQRYICARLGPLPGWSLCYGFDLQEWVDTEQLRVWHEYMHAHLGWFHFLGARAPELTQIYEGLDYSSYQQHRPTYDTYVKAIEQLRPGKPTFFEDRFRIRKDKRYADKDYTHEMTRRGMWHSVMAGGAANIWACLTPLSPSPDALVRSVQASFPYPEKHQLLTYARFWRNRFRKEMVRDNSLTDGVCLTVPGTLYVFYREDASSLTMDLTGLKGTSPAIAVDTRKRYEEMSLGTWDPGPQRVFKAPYVSDWAIVVGDAAMESAPRIDLGVLDAERGLFRETAVGAETTVAKKAGRVCRRNADPDIDRCMYFNVSGAYGYEGSRPSTAIMIEYFDGESGELQLQYDAATDVHKDGGRVLMTGTQVWKTYVFHLSDAHFGNRQENDADFRICSRPGQTFYLSAVSMSAESRRQ